MKRYGRPASIVTDRLQSYRAAMNVIGILERQDCGRWLNNRAENSHQPFRRREGAMARFRSELLQLKKGSQLGFRTFVLLFGVRIRRRSAC